MKAISVRQPHASALFAWSGGYRVKRFETRSWQVSYRGSLVICASTFQLEYRAMRRLLREIMDYWPLGIMEYRALPFGRAIGIVDLAEIYKTDEAVHYGLTPYLTAGDFEREQHMGNFSAGRFAWDTQNPRRFKESFPVRGWPGLFNIPDDLVETALKGEGNA